MTKGIKIEGPAVVVNSGTCLQGLCSLEEYYADLEHNGTVYRWRSNNAGPLYPGLRITLRAFVRPGSDRLYRVTYTKQPQAAQAAPTQPQEGPARIQANGRYYLRGSVRFCAEVVSVSASAVTFHQRMWGYLGALETLSPEAFAAKFNVPA